MVKRCIALTKTSKYYSRCSRSTAIGKFCLTHYFMECKTIEEDEDEKGRDKSTNKGSI